MKGCAGALLLLVTIAAPLSARAQSSDTEQLKKHFEDGSKAFNLGEFKRAVDEYKAAYNIRADPVFLYNIAQAYRLDGNLQQALFFYKSYLTNSPRAPNRHEVDGRIHELESADRRAEGGDDAAAQHDRDAERGDDDGAQGRAPQSRPSQGRASQSRAQGRAPQSGDRAGAGGDRAAAT